MRWFSEESTWNLHVRKRKCVGAWDQERKKIFMWLCCVLRRRLTGYTGGGTCKAGTRWDNDHDLLLETGLACPCPPQRAQTPSLLERSTAPLCTCDPKHLRQNPPHCAAACCLTPWQTLNPPKNLGLWQKGSQDSAGGLLPNPLVGRYLPWNPLFVSLLNIN